MKFTITLEAEREDNRFCSLDFIKSFALVLGATLGIGTTLTILAALLTNITMFYVGIAILVIGLLVMGLSGNMQCKQE